MYILTGSRLLDPRRDALVDGMEVLVEGAHVREVSDRPIRSASAERIDLAGRCLMPGLIDAHVHVTLSEIDLARSAALPSSLVALQAAREMTAMLARGFTTVRDLGGADHGLVRAVDEGLIDGPRLVISGKALSQTGGHADFRGRTDDRDPFSGRLGAIGRLCDGVDAVRRAAREEIKGGADFIKTMANGGVASPNDPIHALGFSRDEMAAVVEEAGNAGTYVSAHLLTDEAIRRAVELGVHSLEHCNLISPETARAAAEAGAIAVPTVVTYHAFAEEAESLGIGPVSIAKLEVVRKAAMESLSIMRDANLTMAFGTDLLGQMRRHQSREFSLLASVLTASDILKSATLVGAQLCLLEGKIGELVPNAYADFLVVDGNPYKDVTILENQGRLAAIARGGHFFKRAF